MQHRNAALIDNLRPEFKARFDPGTAWGDIASMHLLLPGLRGFWPMSARDENDMAIDIAGAARHLTNNGTTPWEISGLRSYPVFNGSSQYLSRADEAGLDITGGLTMGCWVYVDDLPGSEAGVIGKYGAAGQRSYVIRLSSTGTFIFGVTNNGTAETSVTSAVRAVDNWYFVCARYRPSAELALWVNSVKVTNTTSIPASLHSGTAAFEIGAYNGAANYLDGRVALAWLCGDALYQSGYDDVIIETLYHLTRPMFGVREV